MIINRIRSVYLKKKSIDIFDDWKNKMFGMKKMIKNNRNRKKSNYH